MTLREEVRYISVKINKLQLELDRLSKRLELAIKLDSEGKNTPNKTKKYSYTHKFHSIKVGEFFEVHLTDSDNTLYNLGRRLSGVAVYYKNKLDKKYTVRKLKNETGYKVTRIE